MTTKRKDFTPKKIQEKSNTKRARNCFIDLTCDDEDNCKVVHGPRSPRKRLSFNSDKSEIKDEPYNVDEYLCDSITILQK